MIMASRKKCIFKKPHPPDDSLISDFCCNTQYFALQNLTEALIAGLAGCFPLGCCRRWGEWSWSTILMQQEGCFSEAKPWGWLSDSCQSAKGKQNKTKTSTTKMSVEPWVCVGCASAASSSSKVTLTPFTLSQKQQWELRMSEENSASFCIWCTSIGTRCMQWVFEWFLFWEKKRGDIFSTSERPGEKLTEQVWKCCLMFPGQEKCSCPVI